MGNKKECRYKCTCSDFWNWVIKIVGILLLVGILIRSLRENSLGEKNDEIFAITLSFIGILATFVVVNNFGQVYKVEHKIEQMQAEINKTQAEVKDFFDYVSIADSYYANYHAGYYGNNSNIQRRSMFICCTRALELYSKATVFDVSDRINKAIRGLSDVLGVEDKYYETEYSIPFNQKGIDITNDILII